MGHPAVPPAFLAGKLSEIEGSGGRLDAGDVVIAGAPVRRVEEEVKRWMFVSIGGRDTLARRRRQRAGRDHGALRTIVSLLG
jgi:2-keto-4-pentenoate hydratase